MFLFQKPCETLEKIFRSPMHVFETICLKRYWKSKAVNQEALSESPFCKNSQNLKEKICDEDIFRIILPAIWPATVI